MERLLPRVLIAAGIVLVLLGLALLAAPRLPMLGKLPGDIRIERDGFRFYFPITTCLVLSALISLVLYLVSRFR